MWIVHVWRPISGVAINDGQTYGTFNSEVEANDFADSVSNKYTDADVEVIPLRLPSELKEWSGKSND